MVIFVSIMAILFAVLGSGCELIDDDCDHPREELVQEDDGSITVLGSAEDSTLDTVHAPVRVEGDIKNVRINTAPPAAE